MRRADRGSLSVELVFLFPVVLLMVFLVVQGACWWYDRQVALSAAREGAAIAADTQKGGQEPVAAAVDFVDTNALLNGGASVPPPTTSDNDTKVTMTVTVRVNSLLGPVWGGPDITVTATVPLERFVGVGQ
ncbi:TadE/TadG family type IV pilus assembly protein [Streptacidiphilus sp. MAP5-3]|uniref:TadE/TadG family type IV pilus assembly protein n=1 Tax=unclassified Streptacidiphilus TaxID=2643834 RepID=UPI0035140856